jgi:D-alanyl-lipoteichoic acid acyltransferase DltB (MBOAT superfamily)
LWIHAASAVLPRLSPSWRRVFLWAAVLVALQPLLFYKYWRPDGESLLIPVGISFYTFQLVGLLVDCARGGLPRVPFRDFWNFASFFPQIVAGPIERRDSLLPQVEQFRFRFRGEAVEAGLKWIVLGLFYKLVVADNLASSSGWIVDPLRSPWLVHLSNLLFGLRIYFDFCGYSLIALGIGRMLGVHLTMNFLSPYTRRNIRDFWRTWHVSLSRWFRDYVYVPLGGKRARYPALAVMVVFVVSGVWHGAGWNYALWGAAHGFLLVLFRLGHERVRMPGLVAWGLTFFCVTTVWLFFYQQESAVLFGKLGGIVNLPAYLNPPLDEFLAVTRNLGNAAYLAGAAALGLLVVALEFWSGRKKETPYSWGLGLPVQAAMVVMLVWMAPVTDNGFVYFNF